MAASTLHHSSIWLGASYRRVATKHGAPIAIKATARKLAIILCQMIKNQVEFSPVPIDTYNQLLKERKLKYIKNQASMLVFQLIPS